MPKNNDYNPEKEEVSKFLAHYGVKGMKWDPSKLTNRMIDADRRAAIDNAANIANGNGGWIQTDRDQIAALNLYNEIEKNRKNKVYKKKSFSDSFSTEFKARQKEGRLFVKSFLFALGASVGKYRSNTINGALRKAKADTETDLSDPRYKRTTDFWSDHDIDNFLSHDDNTDIVESMMYDDDHDAFLEHFGILGMRWGHRKDRGNSTSSSSGSEKKEPTEHEEAVNLGKKGIKNLSNAELQKYTQRMQLEQQYRQLSAQQQAQHQNAGKEFVKSLAKDTGNALARQYAKQIATVLIDEALANNPKTAKFAKAASKGK